MTGFGLDRRSAILGPLAALMPGSARSQDPGDSRLVTNLYSRLAIGASLNGRRGYSLVIDTGAQRTTLATEVAAALGLPRGPDVVVHGVTEAQTAPSVTLGRLAVAGSRFQGLRCPVFPREALAADGLLGLDVLTRFRLNIDLAGRRVSIAPSGFDDPTLGSAMSGSSGRLGRAPGGRRVRFGQLLLSEASVGGIDVDAFIDTGSQFSLGNAALRDALSRRVEASQARDVMVYGVTGQARPASLATVDGVILAQRNLGPADLLFSDLHIFDVLELGSRPALLIGADLIGRFRNVILDFGRGRITLQGMRPARVTPNSHSAAPHIV